MVSSKEGREKLHGATCKSSYFPVFSPAQPTKSSSAKTVAWEQDRVQRSSSCNHHRLSPAPQRWARSASEVAQPLVEGIRSAQGLITELGDQGPSFSRACAPLLLGYKLRTKKKVNQKDGEFGRWQGSASWGLCSYSWMLIEATNSSLGEPSSLKGIMSLPFTIHRQRWSQHGAKIG